MDKKIDRNENCFTLVRYIAAINVFLLHISHLANIPRWMDVIIRSIHGIPMFFSLSGFLIWFSLERTSDFSAFLKKRLFRLYPELWGGVLTNAIIMILLYKDYIQWKPFFLFQFTQATIFQQWTPGSLRGYGCGTPNGVLGSVSLLLQAYLALWVLYKLLHGKSLRIWISVFSISLVIAGLFPNLKNYLPGLEYKLLEATVIPSLRMFLVGALVAEFFDQFMPFLRKYWYIFLFAYIVMKFSKIPDIQVTHPIIRTVFLGLATLGFGYASHSKLKCVKIRDDITYGIFIYHMPVINALIALGYTNSIYSVLLSLLLTIILAIVSHKTLGSLSLRLKQNL